jgi:hypothetical protein
MANFDLMRHLTLEKGGKILLLVMDGLGGLPREQGGPTELEAAHTPHLDRLARRTWRCSVTTLSNTKLDVVRSKRPVLAYT